MEPSAPAGPAYLRLVALGGLLGIPAALVAALFLALVHELELWLWHDLPDALGYAAPPWFLVIGLPVLGALIVLVARRFLPGDGGHAPLHGLALEPTPVAHAPGIALAALGTLCFGAVLGPEAPVVALGSAVGMVASRFLGSALDPPGTAVLSSAGSFSAISALFGGPIVAGMLLVEGGIGIGAKLLPALVPGLVAAAIGYLIFIGFGSWGGLNAPGLVVPNLPEYDVTSVGDLAVALVVGLLAALVVAVVRPLALRVDGLRARVGWPVLLLAGGVAVGLLAQAGSMLGADSQDVLFSGQSSVGTLVFDASPGVILVLLVAKFLGYAVCLGCGFRGGPIFPAIFLGIGLAALAVVWFGASPTLAVAIGAAAGMAAQTRLLFSPLILAALLIGTAGVEAVPAAAIAAATAWVTTAALDRRPAAATAE